MKSLLVFLICIAAGLTQAEAEPPATTQSVNTKDISQIEFHTNTGAVVDAASFALATSVRVVTGRPAWPTARPF